MSFQKSPPSRQVPPPPLPPAPPNAQPPQETAPTLTADELLARLLDAITAYREAQGTFRQRLLSRKFLATVVYDLLVLGSALFGGLSHHDAVVASTVGTAVYVLAEAIVDAADRFGQPSGS